MFTCVVSVLLMKVRSSISSQSLTAKSFIPHLLPEFTTLSAVTTVTMLGSQSCGKEWRCEKAPCPAVPFLALTFLWSTLSCLVFSCGLHGSVFALTWFVVYRFFAFASSFLVVYCFFAFTLSFLVVYLVLHCLSLWSTLSLFSLAL